MNDRAESVDRPSAHLAGFPVHILKAIDLRAGIQFHPQLSPQIFPRGVHRLVYLSLAVADKPNIIREPKVFHALLRRREVVKVL